MSDGGCRRSSFMLSGCSLMRRKVKEPDLKVQNHAVDFTFRSGLINCG